MCKQAAVFVCFLLTWWGNRSGPEPVLQHMKTHTGLSLVAALNPWRRDAPLVMIRGLTKRALQPRWSNGVTFGIITTEDEEGSKSSVADIVLVWRSGRDSLFISRLFKQLNPKDFHEPAILFGHTLILI